MAITNEYGNNKDVTKREQAKAAKQSKPAGSIFGDKKPKGNAK